MTRTKQTNPHTFEPAKSLQTMTDSDGSLWVETRPGSWENYLTWKERTDVMRETLGLSFRNMKRKEIQSLAISRQIPANQTSEVLIESLINYNIPSLLE